MKQFLSTILFAITVSTIILPKDIFSQNVFVIGNKNYKATEKIPFENSGEDKYLEVAIGKDNESGFLILSCQSTTGVLIKGKAIIYLDNGTVITCLDKGIRDFVNQTATSVYKLTLSELETLKKSNINSIRFSLKCSDCAYSTEQGDFVSTNPYKYDEKANRVKADFPVMVSKLFE